MNSDPPTGHMPLRYPHIEAVFVLGAPLDHWSRQALSQQGSSSCPPSRPTPFFLGVHPNSDRPALQLPRSVASASVPMRSRQKNRRSRPPPCSRFQPVREFRRRWSSACVISPLTSRPIFQSALPRSTNV